MIHYTNKKGYNAISPHPDWTFKAEKPSAAKHNPVGAYFTNLPPDTPRLGVLTRVPKEKREFMFEFTIDSEQTLLPLPGGRGHEGLVYYSPNNYVAIKNLQNYKGESINYGKSE